jgi:hypothetical protein
VPKKDVRKQPHKKKPESTKVAIPLDFDDAIAALLKTPPESKKPKRKKAER